MGQSGRDPVTFSLMKVRKALPLAYHIAAVDIGSNALRAVVARVSDKKIDIIRSLRFPLRLGESVFQNQYLSPKKRQETEEAFIKLLHLFAAYKVQDVEALATSAMRDARNAAQLIEEIKRITGIEIKTISGLSEAKLIYHAVSTQIDFKKKNALLMDIGGGSTELSVIKDGELVASHSFNIGTIRLLRFKTLQEQNQQIHQTCQNMARFTKTYLGKKSIHYFIGTGGNLRRMGKLRREIMKKNSTECSLSELKEIARTLQTMGLDERIKILKLDPNRADVIVPATHLTLDAMKVLDIKKIFLPKVGLKEGILLHMLQDKKRSFEHLR
jgi:exopolyphosphatase / guanosine-5'-triphosphate,3'-diphosphate pyrophosphatase